MHTCLILNILMIGAYTVELCYVYDFILDNTVAKNIRVKYAARLITSSLIVFIAIMMLYKLFGVNSYNLGHYVRYGIVK